MVVEEKTPLCMAEVASLVGKNEHPVPIKEFISIFKPLSIEKAMELKGKLEELHLLKLKEYHVVKIIDFLPKDALEIQKVIPDSSLDSEEVTKVLEVVSSYS